MSSYALSELTTLVSKDLQLNNLLTSSNHLQQMRCSTASTSKPLPWGTQKVEQVQWCRVVVGGRAVRMSWRALSRNIFCWGRNLTRGGTCCRAFLLISKCTMSIRFSCLSLVLEHSGCLQSCPWEGWPGPCKASTEHQYMYKTDYGRMISLSAGAGAMQGIDGGQGRGQPGHVMGAVPRFT